MNVIDVLKKKIQIRWKKESFVLLFLAGILLMVITLPVEKDKDTKEEQTTAAETGNDLRESYTEQLEGRLEQVLQLIQGAGAVKVMITLKNNGEAIVEKDHTSSCKITETGQFGQEAGQVTEQQQSEVTVYEDQKQEGAPFVTKENLPQIEGVLVVAQGGDNAVTAKQISEAIQALFDVEIHKIKIVTMKTQEGTN